ncbi:ABC transporter substrate-binding protein [Streptomyces decoyicus]|uniref:ABC transporter substrate-binding protein n=1 Tax=Streptomyces decoyicus TaxID=249567 RepID=UPI0038630F45|nr:sugar ABC transporter substrate-binding protein [Streptomyces decoyicus]
MRILRAAIVTAAVTALAAVTSGCGGGTSPGGAGDDSPTTLTYWASNQGPNVEADKKILGPELRKFERQTGIKVKLEVIPWPDLLNRILTATTSGQGPDVLNIGNTWSASLQATGALLPWDKENLDAIGGRDRFLAPALDATGVAGKDPAAIPLYSLAYALYYNKQMFKDAGISKPPATWDELVADGKRIAKNGKWGLGAEGGQLTNNIHQAFALGKQHGADFFDRSGRPAFTSDGAVAAVKQYIDFMAKDKIIAPGNAEYGQNQSLRDFATGRTAMVLWQAAATTFAADGMKPDEWGVAPVPVPSGTPGTGRQTNSMLAGINIAVFKNTHNLHGARKFVKFMTSDSEQRLLNKTYGSIPPVTAAQQDPAFNRQDTKVLRETLTRSATPLPQIAEESQFETSVGTAIKDLFADAAAGHPVTTASVKARLGKAEQQMTK